jgi:uncharacterized membrane protein
VPIVSPTRTDPVAARATGLLGGPLGALARTGAQARMLQIVLACGAAVFLLGALRTIPCARIGWTQPQREMFLCYSDIPVLYTLRGIADGGLPYLSDPPAGGQPLEYPVLTGVLTWLAGLLTPSGGAGSYYWVTAALLLGCFLAALAWTAMSVPHRVWDGLLMALAPSVALAGLINWDWLAVALTAGFLLAWARSRPVVAGILLGLAVAAKFYPVLILGPLALLCWRRGKVPDFARTAAAAGASWLAVNLPFALAAPEPWSYFFRFSSQRGIDFGSPWYAMSLWGATVPADVVNLIATGALALLCLGVAWLVLTAPRPPRLASVAFLVVAAFVLTNKVYSPQFVLWLLPLAVLARPRWRDILVWQAAEVVYFVAIWWYLVGFEPEQKGLPPQWYAAAVFVHVAGLLWLVALVVRDIRAPGLDPVRADPVFPGTGGAGFDDPGGGVLDGAPDRLADRVRPLAPAVWLGFSEPASPRQDNVEPGGGEADLAGQLLADDGRYDALGHHDQADGGVRRLVEPQPLPAEPER